MGEHKNDLCELKFVERCCGHVICFLPVFVWVYLFVLWLGVSSGLLNLSWSGQHQQSLFEQELVSTNNNTV